MVSSYSNLYRTVKICWQQTVEEKAYRIKAIKYILGSATMKNYVIYCTNVSKGSEIKCHSLWILDFVSKRLSNFNASLSDNWDKYTYPARINPRRVSWHTKKQILYLLKHKINLFEEYFIRYFNIFAYTKCFLLESQCK